MYIREIAKLVKRPRVFRPTTRLTPAEFRTIIKKMQPLWNKKQNKKKKSGRPHRIKKLENQLLCLLMYYRTYTTQLFLGFFFNADAATVCRAIKTIEPILAKIMEIKKERVLHQEELREILIDCTEQPIQRPTKNQQQYYSGKKKKHTLKTEIQMNTKGRILRISHPVPGKVHDFKLRKSQEKLSSA